MPYFATVIIHFDTALTTGERSAEVQHESEEVPTRNELEALAAAVVDDLASLPGYQVAGEPIGALTWSIEVESIFHF